SRRRHTRCYRDWSSDVCSSDLLDMEEYRDLDLTVTAFREVLDEPEFLPLSAGIVLQAYLPDSHRVQRALTEWALARRARGGAPRSEEGRGGKEVLRLSVVRHST